ncbi:MAG TPA: M20/M25/M40 family metallo-hydrolase [Gemmataceae bacterium]|jgi:acetylornithine deacetylase/succinyl-diaminopimelate desuccinylase-like protein|nr:M20/M25/M40 family metallo-hydrolase [Gemmataceae bacterium]
MQAPLDWLRQNDQKLIDDLARLVAVRSVSTDGEHKNELHQSAALTCELMKAAGLDKVEVLSNGDSYPYAYGEWLGAPGKPTVFLYAHHDVQPVNFEEGWKSPAWQLTERDGRLYGRGAADDKGAIVVQLGAIASYLKSMGKLPCNVKMLVEGEEEVGSTNLDGFFKTHKDKLMSDVIVVCDTENLEKDLPSITYSLRGVVGMRIDVESATQPNHSGMVGGFLADSALALNVLLSRLYWKKGKIPIRNFYRTVRKLTGRERRTIHGLPGDVETWRAVTGVLPGVGLALKRKENVYEQTWRKPAVTVIAQEASSIKGASNQVLPKASAIVSCRIVPDQDPADVYKMVERTLSKDPPWNVKVTCTPTGACKWWMTDPTGPAFEAAMESLEAGYGVKPVAIGCGGSIGFVGPLAELFGGAPALLLGIEDPESNAHAPNESLDRGILRKLTASIAHLFDRLGNLPDGKVK